MVADVSIFAGLNNRIQADIAGEIEWCHIRGGDVLFRQGDDGDSLYIVVSGRLRVVQGDAGADGLVRTLRHVVRGEAVGEISLITGEPRSATVVAQRDSELGRLSREAFGRLLVQEPGSVLGLMAMLARWLAKPDVRLASRTSNPSTIAILSLAREAPLVDFAANLSRSLSAFGRTLHLNAQLLESILGKAIGQATLGNPEYQWLTRWLNDQEGNYQFIVYQADYELTPWTLRCVSQADRILQVALSSESDCKFAVGQLSRLAELNGGNVEQELALIHQTRNAKNTSRWLKLGKFVGHHHIRAGSEADFDRVARHLAGRAVGLVLGGGGARGFAHIGAIKALKEAKIPIDRLGGASMGGVIAAQYASGLSPDEMIDLNRRGWVGLRPHRDYTLPMISLLSGKSVERMLTMMFGDRLFEDLWLNCFCVSTNLSRAHLVVHRNGLVRRWLRAGISIPGTTPPLIDEQGDLLIDGAVLDNLPVTAMRELGNSVIIAVNVSPDVDLVVDPKMQLAPSPWRILRNRILRIESPRHFPSLFQILYRTSVLASIRTGKEVRCEVALYLEPPTGAFDIFDMKAIDRIVEAGYRYTAEKLEKSRIDLKNGFVRR